MCSGEGLFLRADHAGVLVRNFPFGRVRRIAWTDISHFADGRHARQGETRWQLVIVLRTGKPVPVLCSLLAPGEVMAAVREIGRARGIPADLAGAAMRDGGRPASSGLYEDPGGQPGLRYWDGRQRPPVLPPEAGRWSSRAAGNSPPSWSALPAADGPWTYGAAQARRWTARFAVLAAIMAAGLAGGLVIELWWEHGTRHGHVSGGWWFGLAGLAALSAFGARRNRRLFLKLDEAGKGGPPALTAPTGIPEHGPAAIGALPAGIGGDWQSAARARRAGIVFAAVLIASAVTLAGSWVLFVWGSNHHDDYNPSTLAFSAGLLGLVWTHAAWDRRKKLRQTGGPAAGLADPADGSASPPRERGERGAARRPGGLEIAAMILLPAGGFLLLVGWLAGCVLLWVSPRWRRADKLLGTLVWPLGLVPALAIGQTWAHLDHVAGATAGPPPLVRVLILTGLVLGQLGVIAWLWHRARRPPEPNDPENPDLAALI